jgi:ABC-type multidrug transport system ATPase subunit
MLFDLANLSICSKSGVEGSIKYNGADLGSNSVNKLTCYIMQEDYLAPFFTVYEIMTVSANLKLGRNLSEKAKQLLVST